LFECSVGVCYLSLLQFYTIDFSHVCVISNMLLFFIFVKKDEQTFVIWLKIKHTQVHTCVWNVTLFTQTLCTPIHVHAHFHSICLFRVWIIFSRHLPVGQVVKNFNLPGLIFIRIGNWRVLIHSPDIFCFIFLIEK
jgi:hypothetical protein